jgi:cysteine-rich repeat protein
VLLFSACGEEDDKRAGNPEDPDACAEGGCDTDACANGSCEVDATIDSPMDPCADGGCEPDATVDACADGGCYVDACADGGCDAGSDAPAPRCGDGRTDPGEVCDDGNRVDGDGCQNDCTRSQCTTPAQCNDGLFCNGVEQCRAGRCAAGTAPVLDDGIACTDDSCNESADRIDHVANNTRCSSLTTTPRCATTGTLAGRLTRDVGVCQATRGCAAVEQLVDDCLDDAKYPTTYQCAATPSRILRSDGACLSTPTPRCGYSSTVQTQCSTAIPSPHPFCSGTAAANNLTHHYNAVATCSGTPPACGYTEQTAACRARAATCSAARVTTYTATCSASGGCGQAANTSTACTAGSPVCATVGGRPVRRTYTAACNTAGTGCATPGTATDTACPQSAATCGGTPATRTTYTATCAGAGVCAQTSTTQACPDQTSVCQTSPASGLLQLTSYTPACSGTACGTPTAATRTCSGRYACSGRTLQRYAPACNPSTDYCGPASTPASTDDCSRLDSVTCNPVDRSHDDLVTVRGVCDATNGQCTSTTTTAPCPLGNVCVDSQSVRTNSGCRGFTSCQTSVRLCNRFVCSSGGTELWQENGCSGNFCTAALVRPCNQQWCVGTDLVRETGCLGGACVTTTIPNGCPILF